jgi:hypothetical protein
MRTNQRDWRRNVVWQVLACAACLASAGCGEAVVNSGVVHRATAPTDSTSSAGDDSTVKSETAGTQLTQATQPVDVVPPQVGSPTDVGTQDDPARPRIFAVEGPAGAQRINFDDLDLLKLLKMDPVTADCVEKMPEWLKGLGGKKVRVRGFMKPGNFLEGIPQFLLVRSTDMCCFGPKGKVYHMIAVSLKPGTTTSYIELRPFDVEGTFRIETVQLDDESIILLYHIDQGTIIRS